MMPDAKVDALQVHGPVLLHRADGRWYATWQVQVAIGVEPFEQWPSEQGVTPSDAICKLWDRFADYHKTLEFLEPTARAVRWNAKWQDMPVPAALAAPIVYPPARVPTECGKDTPLGPCANVVGHEGECDGVPF